MNNSQKTCDPERIELFLGQKLSDEEQTAFELHLDDCNDCRHRLEATAAGDDVWSAVRDSLPGQQLQADCPRSGDPALDSALDSASGGDASFSHDTVLKLLAPTDDERMLGRLGTYEVVGVVGSGGMGVVLKAFDAALNRYVAIKVLAPHLGSGGAARKRFSREAQAAAAVVHDNVIEIHGVADADGLPYLVMPYVRGPSLQRRLDDDGPLALVEILRVAVQAASGLAAAHAQGLVHRDVKPANILLADGVERVKLTDFGLARAADDASLTRTGIVAGTPQYMSPEQARGELVDQRSDLFSLGSVLYAMCTGRAPFRAETSYGVLRRITDEEPGPIREINPEIPEWLCQIIARLMSKQPGDRFESAREVAELLEECLAHVQQPTAVPLPASLVTQSNGSRFFSISRRSLGVIAMIAAFGLSLLGMVLWQATTPPDIAGKWTGEEWGAVVLEARQPGQYEGSYTDSDNARSGTVHLKWSRVERRFNGTWREGDDRNGKISLRLVGDEIRGAWTTDAKSKLNPKTPALADLQWMRMVGQPPDPRVRDVDIAWGPPAEDGLEVGVRIKLFWVGGNTVSGGSESRYATEFFFRNKTGRTVAAFGHRIAFKVDARRPSGEKLPVKSQSYPLDTADFLLEVGDHNQLRRPGEGIVIIGPDFKDSGRSLESLFGRGLGWSHDAPLFTSVVHAERRGAVRLRFRLPHPAKPKGPELITGEVAVVYSEFSTSVDNNPNKSRSTLQPKTTTAMSFEPFDCLLVDEKSGDPIPGNDFAISLRFVIPRAEGRPWQLVDEVFLGPDHPGTFKFTVPDKVLRHPDRDLIVVQWTIVHPRLDQRDGHGRIRVNEILRNDPRTAREAIRRIKLHPANIRKGQRPEHFNEFTARVYVLQRLRVLEVGRDELIAAYERLMKEFPDHPDRAAAMFEIASAWDCTDPGMDIQPDHAKVIEWLRKACAAARSATPLWFEARFHLQGRIRWESLDEAHKLLDEILGNNPGPVNEVRAWRHKQRLALHQKDEEEAERICRQLQGWMSRKDKRPVDMFELGRYFQEIQMSAYAMMDHWAQPSSGPSLEGKAKIDSLRHDYPFRHMGRWYQERASRYGLGWATQMAPEPQPKTTTAMPKRVRHFTTVSNLWTIAYSPDGKLIAVANENPKLTPLADGLQVDGTSRVRGNWTPSVEILDAATGKTVVSLKLTTDDEDAVLAATERVSHFEVTALAFSPDGNVAAVGTSIGQVKLFNAQTGELVRSLDDEKPRLADKETSENWKPLKRAMGSVTSLAFSPDSSLLAVSGGSFVDFSDLFDSVIRLGRSKTGPGRLKLWEIKTGTLKHDLAGHSHANAVAFSPDGNFLASAGLWNDNGVPGSGAIIWNPHSGKKVRQITTLASKLTRSVAFSPDSKKVAIISQHYHRDEALTSTMGAVSLSYVLSGMMDWLVTFPGWAKPVAFSPDGKSVAVLCGGRSIRFLETESGKVKHEIRSTAPQGGRWNDFAITRQGHMLAIGGVDNERRGSVELWDLDGLGTAADSAPVKDGED